MTLTPHVTFLYSRPIKFPDTSAADLAHERFTAILYRSHKFLELPIRLLFSNTAYLPDLNYSIHSYVCKIASSTFFFLFNSFSIRLTCKYRMRTEAGIICGKLAIVFPPFIANDITNWLSNWSFGVCPPLIDYVYPWIPTRVRPVRYCACSKCVSVETSLHEPLLDLSPPVASNPQLSFAFGARLKDYLVQ